MRSVDEAKRAADAGVDAITAQGTEAGGHTGRMSTLPLVPAVVDAVAPLPVLAAGGIADGRGVAAALVLGADGVWIGTRFLATDECGVPDDYKARVLAASGGDTVLTEVFDIAWCPVARRRGRARVAHRLRRRMARVARTSSATACPARAPSRPSPTTPRPRGPARRRAS